MRSPQDLANAMLADWQRQRLAGIPPERRVLNDNDEFERMLEPVRRAMERKS